MGTVKGAKIGDWILATGNIGVRKINARDAGEIISLLEDSKQINKNKIDLKLNDIFRRAWDRRLTKDDLLYLLRLQEDEDLAALYSEANVMRKTILKDFICIHGIIEFSNYCQNDCAYCGLRSANRHLRRYRMTINEITAAAGKAIQRGYKLLVLQSGEDFFYSDDALAEIVRKIKEKNRVFIFMSVGERGYECYKKLKAAGASGVLFRYETSNPRLFKKLHPRGKNLARRLEHLKFMKELGFFIATGSLIGLPGQTEKDLLNDLLTTKKYANMVSMGPFIPTADTPLAKSPHTEEIKNWKVRMNLKMIAILRLLIPEARIPVVTALETLAGEDGRKQALHAGANSLMFNLTPAKYRPLYKIYGNKFYQKENIWEKYGLFKYEESYKMLEERMAKELERNEKQN